MRITKFIVLSLLVIVCFFLFLLAIMRMFPIVIAAPLLFFSIYMTLLSFTERKRRFKGF